MLTRIWAGGSMAVCGFLFTGLLMFGPDLPSYLVASVDSLRGTVKETVPLGLELQRARDLLDTMMPEVHSKIRQVAHEEVALTALKKQIRRNQQQLARRAHRLGAMRAAIETQTVSTLPQRTRENQLRHLSVSFQEYKEAENLLASQRQLLRAREVSLQAAKAALDDYRAQQALIQQKIESLVARHQLVEVRSTLTPGVKESTQLAEIEELLTEVEQRIEIASRILDHETELLPLEDIPCPDDADVLAEVDRYLNSPIGTLDSNAVEMNSCDDKVERVIE